MLSCGLTGEQSQPITHRSLIDLLLLICMSVARRDVCEHVFVHSAPARCRHKPPPSISGPPAHASRALNFRSCLNQVVAFGITPDTDGLALLWLSLMLAFRACSLRPSPGCSTVSLPSYAKSSSTQLLYLFHSIVYTNSMLPGTTRDVNEAS